MISIIIDFSDKVEDFIEEPVTLKQIIVDYYLNWVFRSLVVLSVYDSLVATEKEATEEFPSKCRTSGSFPRLPTKMTLLIMMCVFYYLKN